jgi:hypothetical protein
LTGFNGDAGIPAAGADEVTRQDLPDSFIPNYPLSRSAGNNRSYENVTAREGKKLLHLRGMCHLIEFSIIFLKMTPDQAVPVRFWAFSGHAAGRSYRDDPGKGFE